MYWFIALFDSKTENVIKKLEDDIRHYLIPFHSEKIKNGRPHLTLGHYYELDKEEYIRLIEAFYEPIACFDITFNTIGSFLNYSTLFLSPTITKELIDFHSNHYYFFDKFNGKANSLYLPDQWTPHCTIVNRLAPEKLTEAFNYSINNFQPLRGSVEYVALVEMIGDYNQNFETEIVFSKSLKK